MKKLSEWLSHMANICLFALLIIAMLIVYVLSPSEFDRSYYDEFND